MSRHLRQPKGSHGGTGGQFAVKPSAADHAVHLSLPSDPAESSHPFSIGLGIVTLEKRGQVWTVDNTIGTSGIRQKFLAATKPEQVGQDLYASIIGKNIANKLSSGEWDMPYATEVTEELGELIEGYSLGDIENDEIVLGVADCLLDVREQAATAHREENQLLSEYCKGFPGVDAEYLKLENIFIDALEAELTNADGLYSVAKFNSMLKNPSDIADMYDRYELLDELSYAPSVWEEYPKVIAFVMLSQYHKQQIDPTSDTGYISYHQWLENTTLPYRDCWKQTVAALSYIMAQGNKQDRELASTVVQEIASYGINTQDEIFKKQTQEYMLTLHTWLKRNEWNAQNAIRKTFDIPYHLTRKSSHT